MCPGRLRAVLIYDFNLDTPALDTAQRFFVLKGLATVVASISCYITHISRAIVRDAVNLMAFETKQLITNESLMTVLKLK